METKTKILIKLFILPLLLAAVLANYYAYRLIPELVLRIDFFDVGQGDSFLLTTYEGNDVLVDGGPGDTVIQKLGEALPFYDKTIEMMILTHPHLDHFEGLIAVLARYEVKKILLPNVEFDSKPYQKFLDSVKQEQAEVIYAVQGQRIYLDRSTVLDILYPESKDPVRPKKSDDINDTSIVAKLQFGKSKALLMGDTGIEIENKLLSLFDLNVDILKVGHHGSKHSTSDELVAESTPDFSIIQVGKNNYGHPAPEIIRRLTDANSEILRTDQTGTIRFVSDGANWFRQP